MELKTRYQYSYFIYPYVIAKTKYIKYIQKLLKHPKCELRFFEQEKDVNLYRYFSPNIRKNLFPTFEFSKSKRKKFEELEVQTKAAILAKYPCSVFTYNLEKEIPGKLGTDDGIFFKIQKIEMVCFSTGICFLLLKTTIENTNQFSDLLNFNCKFRERRKGSSLGKYENIKIQTNIFENMKEIDDLIESLTGENTSAAKLDISKDCFLTYSYACLEQDCWNEAIDFEEIEHEFYKFKRILPSEYNIHLEQEEEKEDVTKLKYVKVGFSPEGNCLLTSGVDPYNYTKLPHEYENEYLYTYILTLYKKLYLKQMNLEYKKASKTKQVRKDFINFTQKLWIEDITANEAGSVLYKKWQKVLGIDRLYEKIKGRYDVLYKELNIEKTIKINKIIMAVLLILLFVNVTIFFQLLNS